MYIDFTTGINESLNWIECGLPFYHQVESYPEIPDLYQDFRNNFQNHIDDIYIPYAETECESTVEEYIDEIGKGQEIGLDELERIYGSGTRFDYCNPNHMKIFKEALLPWLGNNEGEVDKVIVYRKYRVLQNNWINNHPRMIQYRKDFNRVLEDNAKLSFTGQKLNKPGTLIEIFVNDVKKVFLIGHINSVAGVCNDCVEFDEDCIVTRYATIIDFGEE